MKKLKSLPPGADAGAPFLRAKGKKPCKLNPQPKKKKAARKGWVS